MQLLSNKNNSEFYVFVVYEKSRYEPFKKDQTTEALIKVKLEF